MKRADFPKGPTPPPIIFSHFPTVQQAFIWRNWEMFPAEKLAEVLRTDAKNVLEMAAAMGLRTPPVVNGDWLKKGYNTIIRANWHLLPYEQLLQLLDWTEERLVYALKEDDFLFAKLGALKPDSAPVKYEPLTDEQKTRTRALAALIGKHFPDCAEAEAERAFAFSKYNVASEPEEPFRCGSGEVLVDGSWGIVLSPSCETANVRGYVDDFIQEIKGRWGHALTIGGQKKRAITLSLAPDRGLPPESHSVSVSGDGVAISGVDEFALLRALQWIEMKMEERSGPALPPGLFAMRTTLESRIIYPYHSHYSDPLMADPEETCPDALLKQLSRGGVNGIWLQGILYTLVPWERGPELSRGWERRIESLRNIVGRAARHGVGVYLYMGEPRCLPMSFFERNPELKGIVPSYVFGDVATLCVSTTPVKEFLRDGMAELFTKVPELAGVFTITASENPSNCHSKYSGSSCPRCSRRSPQEVIAEVNALIEEGVHRAKPDARVLAWTWGWRTDWEGGQISLQDWAPGVIERLPAKVELLATSEEAMSLCVGSVSSYMKDYSIAYPGPSERTFRVWEMAERRGLKTAAKIQLNNSWEGAAVPYIPALNLVDIHLRNLLDAKVRSVVVSWTLGGCPSTPNLLRLRDFIWKTEGAPRSLLDFARAVYGEGASGKVCMAWKLLSDALQKFPHNIPVLYYSPLHMGPANLLYSSYSDYRATMVSFPYNDLSRWRGIYTEDIFVEQFKKLSEDWAKGVDLLDGIEPPANRRQRAALKDLTGVARANYCHFRTTCLQACFIIQRDRLYRLAGLDGIIRKNPERAEVIKGILAILAEEIELAKTLRLLARHDSRLGFEATQHYYYRAEDLMEKVLNCEALSDYFKRLLEEATR